MTEKALRLMNFLRFIHSETTKEPIKISLIEKLKEYDLPQPGNICKFLLELKIIERKGQFVKWIHEDGPTVAMTEKVFTCIADYWKEKGSNKKVAKKEIKPAATEIITAKKEIKVTQKETPQAKPSLDFILSSASDEEIINVLKNRGFTGSLEYKKLITL